MKLIQKITEIDNSDTLLILKHLLENNYWLGLKELQKIWKYYPTVNNSINNFMKQGMLLEKLEPYNCGRKTRPMWKVNRDNNLIKLMESQI